MRGTHRTTGLRGERGRRHATVPLFAGASTIGLSLALVCVCGPAAGAATRGQRTAASAASAASRTTVTVAAAGDIACRPGSEPAPDKCQQKATSDLVLEADPDAVLALGDDQNLHGALSDYQGSYDKTWGAFLDETYPVPGNHDYDTAGAKGYYAYFGDRAGDPDKGYYSFDLGAWHLIALNSNCDEVGGCESGSPQERWLRSDLKEHPSRCTLAFWHAPRYSSGKYRPSNSTYEDFWKDLYRARAELVLSGHAQHYERFARQDADGNADPRGVRQFVVGTGGQQLHPLNDRLPTTQARDNETFGVLELTLKPTSYSWTFVPVGGGGDFTDSGHTSCH